MGLNRVGSVVLGHVQSRCVGLPDSSYLLLLVKILVLGAPGSPAGTGHTSIAADWGGVGRAFRGGGMSDSGLLEGSSYRVGGRPGPLLEAGGARYEGISGSLELIGGAKGLCRGREFGGLPGARGAIRAAASGFPGLVGPFAVSHAFEGIDSVGSEDECVVVYPDAIEDSEGGIRVGDSRHRLVLESSCCRFRRGGGWRVVGPL